MNWGLNIDTVLIQLAYWKLECEIGQISPPTATIRPSLLILH